MYRLYVIWCGIMGSKELIWRRTYADVHTTPREHFRIEGLIPVRPDAGQLPAPRPRPCYLVRDVSRLMWIEQSIDSINATPTAAVRGRSAKSWLNLTRCSAFRSLLWSPSLSTEVTLMKTPSLVRRNAFTSLDYRVIALANIQHTTYKKLSCRRENARYCVLKMF